VAFELEQPCDFAYDEIAVRQTESAAECGIVFRRQKRFECKTAEDFCVLLRAANSGSQVLLPHRIGDGDEMGGRAGGVLLGCAKNQIGNCSLEFAKRRAVNSVYDCGYAGPPGGEPPQDARLAAVGVDQVGLLLAEDFSQPDQGAPIVPRMHRAHEFGNQGQQSGTPCASPASEPSGPVAGPEIN